MKNLACLAMIFLSALPAPAATFNFGKSATFSVNDKNNLRRLLETRGFTFPVDGSILDQNGQKLSEEKAREYLFDEVETRLKRHKAEKFDFSKKGDYYLLHTAPANAAFWDGQDLKEIEAGADGKSYRYTNPHAFVMQDAHHGSHSVQLPQTGPVGLKRFNPVWWFKNDDDAVIPSWYLPKSPQSDREFMWFFRNPLTNFMNDVVGLEASNYKVVGRYVGTNNLPGGGWNWTVIKHGPLRLPFVCYYKPSGFTFYLGWRPNNGAFGASVRILPDQPAKPKKPAAKAVTAPATPRSGP